MSSRNWDQLRKYRVKSLIEKCRSPTYLPRWLPRQISIISCRGIPPLVHRGLAVAAAADDTFLIYSWPGLAWGKSFTKYLDSGMQYKSRALLMCSSRCLVSSCVMIVYALVIGYRRYSNEWRWVYSQSINSYQLIMIMSMSGAIL